MLISNSSTSVVTVKSLTGYCQSSFSLQIVEINIIFDWTVQRFSVLCVYITPAYNLYISEVFLQAKHHIMFCRDASLNQ